MKASPSESNVGIRLLRIDLLLALFSFSIIASSCAVMHEPIAKLVSLVFEGLVRLDAKMIFLVDRDAKQPPTESDLWNRRCWWVKVMSSNGGRDKLTFFTAALGLLLLMMMKRSSSVMFSLSLYW